MGATYRRFIGINNSNSLRVRFKKNNLLANIQANGEDFFVFKAAPVSLQYSADVQEGRVRFVGVSRDSAEKDVRKYISRIGNDMPELGENGIILSGGIPLAFDTDSQVNAAFKDILQVKSLGVDHAFVVDSEGIIRWRTLFNRGKEPSGQFGVQLDHIVAGEDVDKVFGPTPVEDDDDDEDEEEEAADQSKASSIAAMACDDY